MGPFKGSRRRLGGDWGWGGGRGEGKGGDGGRIGDEGWGGGGGGSGGTTAEAPREMPLETGGVGRRWRRCPADLRPLRHCGGDCRGQVFSIDKSFGLFSDLALLVPLLLLSKEVTARRAKRGKTWYSS